MQTSNALGGAKRVFFQAALRYLFLALGGAYLGQEGGDQFEVRVEVVLITKCLVTNM